MFDFVFSALVRKLARTPWNCAVRIKLLLHSFETVCMCCQMNETRMHARMNGRNSHCAFGQSTSQLSWLVDECFALESLLLFNERKRRRSSSLLNRIQMCIIFWLFVLRLNFKLLLQKMFELVSFLASSRLLHRFYCFSPQKHSKSTSKSGT